LLGRAAQTAVSTANDHVLFAVDLFAQADICAVGAAKLP
jgi:hypothetical protein